MAWYLFPVERGLKRPKHGFMWKQDSTDDPAQWEVWRDQGYDLAVDLSKSNMRVFDPDTAEGEAAFIALELPATYTVQTTRGKHRYYASCGPGMKFAPGLDLKGEGGYVVWEAADRDVIDERPPAALPSSFILPDPREPRPAAVEVEDLPHNLARARAFLAAHTPAVEGQGGNDHTYQTAATLRDLGISEDKSLELMLEGWNERCDPPWDADDLAEVIAHAWEYGQNEPGAQAVAGDPRTKFLDIVDPDVLQSDDPDDGPLTDAELHTGDFPRAQHLWKNFLLAGHVNLLYGHGGAGKTLLAEHIAVAVAAGIQLFGLETQQRPVLMVLAEDDYGETKARLEVIRGMLDVQPGLPLKIWCRPGLDSSIAHVDDSGGWQAGVFMQPLRTQLAEIGPCLLVLDTVSDIATLNESLRMPVNTLCKVVLGGLCKEFDSTLLINAHPSKASTSSGDDYAGSTAWNNAVRNRLTLKQERDRPQRTLTVAKANYGANASMDLHLFGQTFQTVAAPGQSDADERKAVFLVVLDLLNRGINVVRGNGQGQKPSDIGAVVHEQHGLKLQPQRVLAHLQALERSGHLVYEAGVGHVRAGFRIGESSGESL